MTGQAVQSGTPETRICEMVFPEQANHYGTLFGGAALSLMSKAAFIAASRHARAPVVLAGSEGIEIHHPVAVGQLLELHARVARAGNASMTVEVDVVCETLVTGARTQCMTGRFEMVSVDDAGKPKAFAPVP